MPTPIGNLEDITFRAIRILKDVDLILAEDTRKSKILLKTYEIETPVRSYHAHNEHKLLDTIIDKLRSGVVIGLISDAGTPGISDPGFLLVRECLREGIPVECLPGPTAFIPALIKSGLPADQFVFEGFLPHKKGRKKKLEKLIGEERTMIFYESPYRLLKTLGEMIEFFGKERAASISRELTKIHEETINGSLVELKSHFTEIALKGEFVIIVGGRIK